MSHTLSYTALEWGGWRDKSYAAEEVLLNSHMTEGGSC